MQQQKIESNLISNVITQLARRRAEKCKKSLEMEYGIDFLKRSESENAKYWKKEIEESAEEFKEHMRMIYRMSGKERFWEFVEELKDYSDDDFNKDMKEIFPNEWKEIQNLNTCIKILENG